MRFLPVISCVTLGKSVNLSGLLFLDLGNREGWTRSPRSLVAKWSMFTKLQGYLICIFYPLWQPWMQRSHPFTFVSTEPGMTLWLSKISDFITNLAASHINSLVSWSVDGMATLDNLSIPYQASLKETASLKLLLKGQPRWLADMSPKLTA